MRDVLLELWQANAQGRYVHPANRQAGRALDPAWRRNGLLRPLTQARHRHAPHNPAMIFERFLASAEVMQALDERAFVQALLDFGAALARVQSGVCAIPAGAGEAIAAACRIERFDIDVASTGGLIKGSLDFHSKGLARLAGSVA